MCIEVQVAHWSVITHGQTQETTYRNRELQRLEPGKWPNCIVKFRSANFYLFTMVCFTTYIQMKNVKRIIGFNMLFESAIYFYKGHTNFIVMLGRGDLSLLLLLFFVRNHGLCIKQGDS